MLVGDRPGRKERTPDILQRFFPGLILSQPFGRLKAALAINPRVCHAYKESFRARRATYQMAAQLPEVDFKGSCI